jgi:hypothetical protein
VHKDESPWDFTPSSTTSGPSAAHPITATGPNQLFSNPIVSYHFGDGWSVGSSPEITTNWIASRGNGPSVGGGFGKLVGIY